ncbi:tRNA (guanine-N(7)-)-methyltransferase [Gammaproteobacteria bacterium]
MHTARTLIPRTVRSFTRRVGRITDAQQRNLDTLWGCYGLEANTGMLDLSTAFGRDAPIWLEIGFGNGEFLVSLAAANPEVNFLGIEVHRPGIGRLLGRLQEAEIHNVRLFAADAVEVLCCCIADGILQRIYLLFPDPWPKQRHHKRRLLQPDFVTLLGNKCAIGGQFHLATDWEDYALQMMTVLSAAPGWINPAGVGVFSPRPPERLLTRFESRGLGLGYGVRDLIFIRKF